MSIAALAMAASTGAISAQVTFEQVEAALVALEASARPTQPQGSVSAGQDGAGSGAVATLPPVLTTLPPPPLDREQATAPPGSAEVIGGLEFLPILEGQACPATPPEITEGAERLAADLRRTEVEMLAFEEVFASLEQENAALEANRDLTTCPEDFVEDVEGLLGALADFDLLAQIQEAESFSACSQARVQALNDRMAALQASTDPNAGTERLAVGQLMSRMAVVDGEVSRGVGTLVFFDQRRGRLAAAAGAMLRRCEILSGY